MSANARVNWAATRRLVMGSAVEHTTCAFPMQRVPPRTMALAKELSMELGPLHIRVNSVAPGRIQTARGDQLLEATARTQRTSSDAILGQLIKTIPSGRVGTGDDIADVVCFLVSERASYVNGAALVVDGSKSLVI